MERSPRVCQACKSDLHSVERGGYELTRCRHGFCKPCLGAIVADGLFAHRSAQEFSIVTCPVEECGCTLSRQDLRCVVGPSVFNLLSEHVMQLVTQNVICPRLGQCPNCEDSLLHSAHKLNSPVLRTALQCIGRNNTHSIPRTDLVQLLQDVLLCSRCFLVICDKCGARLTSLTDSPHQCDPLHKTCFDFAGSITKLCSSYVLASHSYIRKRNIRNCSLFSLLLRRNKKESRSSRTDRELRPSLTDSELILKSVVSWFYEGGSEERILGMSFKKLRASNGNRALCAVFWRKRRRVAVDVTMEKLAAAALQELTSSITEMMKKNQGSLSPAIVALLCSDSLPYTLVKWLIRNESIVDITLHSDLYRSMLAFLRAVSSSWDLLPLLCCNPQLKHDSWVATSRWETPGSVMSDFEMLFKQAQFMLRHYEHLGEDEEAQPGITTLVADVKATYELLRIRIKEWEEKTSQHKWLADTSSSLFGSQIASALGRHKEARSAVADEERLQVLYDQIKALISKDDLVISAGPNIMNTTNTCAMPTDAVVPDSHHNDNCSPPPGPPSAALVESYKKALRPLQFDEGCLLPSHYFRKDVESNKVRLNKRHALVISNELVQLNTALPLEWESSIFLRVDEQKADLLRALVIGPEGTPYENGVFLFDLLLGDHYPDMPPKVQFLTTGAGRVRFNPNLYSNGRVCLSILGTWHGPGWKPGESSIMQVLVSIQALVMVADPYYNEPLLQLVGRRSAADTYILDQH